MGKKLVVVVGVLVVLGVVLVLFQLGGRKEGLRAGFDAEFLSRPDGYKPLSQHYGFRFPSEPMQMDPGLMYRAVADGSVDVIDAFATDGRIAAYDLAVLEDDQAFFPPYYAAPLVRREALEKHPELEGILNRLAGRLSDETIQGLNYEVDEKGRKAADVARDFLVEQGLIEKDAGPGGKSGPSRSGLTPGDGSAGELVVGGKQFTEQEILGELMAILVEMNTGIKVDRKLNLGGTMICFNALEAGDLDLYAEYTGTGLVNILKRDVIKDPDETYRVVKEAFDEDYGLVWLEPFGFNNTYTLTMRRDRAEELGIRTISDLAARLAGSAGD